MPSDPLNESGGKVAPAASGRDRRRDPRYPLMAEARVTDIGSGTEFKARISDLSVTGCYLDFLNPIPDRYRNHRQDFPRQRRLRNHTLVVYVHPAMGMGIRFTDTKPTQQAILTRWIAELAASEA